jgi:hypothetical protein
MPRKRYTRSVEPELLTVAQFLALGAQPDGTVVRVILDAAAGSNVRLRFNAGTAGAAKWEVDGWTPGIVAQVAAASNLVAITGGFTDPADALGPSITLPLGGEWDFSEYASFVFSVGGAGTIGVGLMIGGGDIAGELYTGRAHFSTINAGAAQNPFSRIGSIVAGQVAKMRYYGTGAGQTSIATQGRRLVARPCRVIGP